MKTQLALLVILLLFVSSCSPGGVTSRLNNGKNEITDAEFRKGTDGLTISFVKNTPEEIYDNIGIFPVPIDVRNRGAADITEAWFSFASNPAHIELNRIVSDSSQFTKGSTGGGVGNNPFDLGFITRSDNFGNAIIEGKSRLNPNGGSETLQLNLDILPLPGMRETKETDISVTTCYGYETKFGASVCIDTDPFRQRTTQPVCTVKDLSGDSQGAPIAITSIEVKMLPSESNPNTITPHFVIHIENKGNGQIINSQKLFDACSSSELKADDFNRVNIEAFLSRQTTDTKLTCNKATGHEGLITLRDNKAKVRCTLENPPDDKFGKNLDPYTTPIDITLTYGYRDIVKKDFKIQKITY